TKHADVIVCNRDAGTFSSDSSRGGVVGLEEREISEMEQAQEGGKLMLFMDPPDHTRYRKLVNRGFTPRMIGQMETHIRELTNAIAHGMNAFLENPDQWDLLASDVEGHIKGATEEILRWASPVMYFRRNATKDFTLREHTIKAGDKISLWYISANRDEDVWADPFTFDITRDPNPH